MLLTKKCTVIHYDLDIRPTNIIHGHYMSTYPLINGIMWVKYESAWSKGREDMLRTRIFHIILLWPSHWTLKTASRSLHPLYSKALFNMWSMSWIGLIRKYIYALEKEILHGLIWPCPTNIIQGHCIPFDQTLCEVWAILDQGEKRYTPGQGFYI